MNDGGKGSVPRPFSVSDEVFAKNFEAIFGKKNDKPKNSTESGESEQLPRDDEENGRVEQ